jgi:osmoprotectant transport system ATP-binding protein
MISLVNVSKLYGTRRVVDRLGLDIKAGSICVLVGPSGCGKSTTLRMINALVSVDEGTITIDGKDVRRSDPAELRRGIGYVIQSGGLFPHWTVADNIATVPRLLRWPEAKVAARVDELVKLIGLDVGHISSRFPHQLSGGQQQRVAIARALVQHPAAILADEPIASVDPALGEQIVALLCDLARERRIALLCSLHQPELARRYFDRVVELVGGRVRSDRRTERASMRQRGYAG